jgi:O-acetyl-ADP-ribose deacetylase (regulator of RNase III)
MDLAQERSLTSLAFPAISCGVYRFPLDRAARIAVRTINERLPHCPALKRIFLVAFEAPVEAALREALEESV